MFEQKLGAIKQALQDRRLYVVARETGVSYPTIKRLADGVEGDYKLSTIARIANYLGV